MKQILLIENQNKGVCYWRFSKPLNALLADGEDLDIRYVSMSDIMRRAVLIDQESPGEEAPVVRALDEALAQIEGLAPDIVWTNESLLDTQVAWMWARDMFNARIVLDVDDDLCAVPSEIPAHVWWRGHRPDAFRVAISRSDERSVSTLYLQEKYGGTLTPNFIDFAEFESPLRVVREGQVLMYCVVTDAKSSEWARMELPITQMLDKYDDVCVVFAGNRPDWATDRYPAGKVIEQRWFPVETYASRVGAIHPDIVVAPLIENDFNRAKSNLKVLEAAGWGAAFVGQRWGEYITSVDEGETGLLAATPLEFADALERVICDKQLRQRLATANAHKVRECWTWPNVRSAWTEAIFHGDHSSWRSRSRDNDVEPAVAGSIVG